MDAEAIYADDAMHGFLHLEPVFVVSAVGFTAHAIADRARIHGIELNFGAGKTEAILSLRGPGAKALRQEIEVVSGIFADKFTVRVAGAYKHLGTLVTSTACPTPDAARLVSLVGWAYARVSGHF